MAHELIDFTDDGVKTVGQYGFYRQTQLQTVNLPIATSVANSAFQYCSGLEKADFGTSCSFSSPFGECSKLEALVLRSEGNICTLSGSLAGTKIAMDAGGIYVPSTKIDAYKAASSWKLYKHLIFPISEYPRASFATVTDTWAEIVAASANGTYASKYNVGDTAMMTIGNHDYMVQLVAKDADERADGNGTAHMTWLMHGVYVTTHRMHASIAAWPDTEMRSWLISDVLTAMPEVVQNAAVAVKKTYGYYDGSTLMDGISNDTIWIPSSREVCLTGNYLNETNGVQYSGIFSDNSSRIKSNTSGSTNNWWLRSAGSS